MEKIVKRASLDPKSSLLSGYYHQLSFFANSNVSQNMLSSPIVSQTLQLTRDKLPAFKFLTMNPNHFTCIKDLPPNYTVLVLQHNNKKFDPKYLFLIHNFTQFILESDRE
jgi:hypothetical protein